MTSDEKNFVYKQVFTGFPLRELQSYCGKKENHFSFPWRVYLYTGQGLVYTQLQCLKFAGNEDWFVDAHVQVYVFGKSGEELASRKVVHFSKSSNDLEIWRSRVNPNISDFLLVDNKLTLEIHVQIKNMSGAKEKLKSFDESMKDFSDIVLVVDNERFYVNKMYLASHSAYFKKLFIDNPVGSVQSEILVTDMNRNDFQNYLELIHGDSAAIDDDTVDGILQLADILDSKVATKNCVDFLLNKSKKLLRHKFDLAVDYKLDALKEKCITGMISFDDIRSVVPKTSKHVEDSVWKELLMKALSMH
ncbi:hypothetical protein GCK72_009254 [Caenorhabditis remanei]|uniref:BTB domain-containing protein n=1 Tax=Caenorhabditis remanei TaxID=31234 RepID=A0A6A5H1V1_CAERE|nr:hypothetical protein GCK72_009254 [Caenorhabditis remanei]KAF1761001.1 hypothetical protein GCK72_009254 [Caenorhabditis remanei]